MKCLYCEKPIEDDGYVWCCERHETLWLALGSRCDEKDCPCQ